MLLRTQGFIYPSIDPSQKYEIHSKINQNQPQLDRSFPSPHREADQARISPQVLDATADPFQGAWDVAQITLEDSHSAANGTNSTQSGEQ